MRQVSLGSEWNRLLVCEKWMYINQSSHPDSSTTPKEQISLSTIIDKFWEVRAIQYSAFILQHILLDVAQFCFLWDCFPEIRQNPLISIRFQREIRIFEWKEVTCLQYVIYTQKVWWGISLLNWQHFLLTRYYSRSPMYVHLW